MNKPPWIVEAEKNIGVAEIPGKENNPIIVGWLKKLKAWWNNDDDAWCGTFVAICFTNCGMAIPNAWYRALTWSNFGVAIAYPCYGCVVIFSREGGGHVGFVVGKDKLGRLLVLGGNQKNKVCVEPFEMGRAIGYRLPIGYSEFNYPLPVFENSSSSSTNER